MHGSKNDGVDGDDDDETLTRNPKLLQSFPSIGFDRKILLKKIYNNKKRPKYVSPSGSTLKNMILERSMRMEKHTWGNIYGSYAKVSKETQEEGEGVTGKNQRREGQRKELGVFECR